MTFEDWIRKQKDRNDPIGDLANDFIFSAKMSYFQDNIKIKLTLEYLKENRACDAAIEAYREARKQYKESLTA